MVHLKNLSGYNKKRVFIIFFIVINLILSSYFIDIWPTPNPVSRALPVLTFSENHSLVIDQYAEQTMDKSKVGSHFYSDKAPLPTIFMIPVYEVMKILGLDTNDSSKYKKFPVYTWRSHGIEDAKDIIYPKIIPIIISGGFLFGSLPFVLALVLCLWAIFKIKTTVSPVLIVMLAFYGSFIFVFSGTFFNHVFAGTLLLLSYIFLKKDNYFLSGLFVGLAFLTEYTLGALIILWGMLILMNEKSIKKTLYFATGVFPSMLFILIYNYAISGDTFKMLNAYHAHAAYNELSHNYGFHLPSLKAIWGLSFSGSMGLFIFAPILFMVLFFYIKSLKKDKTKQRLTTRYLTLSCLLFFLIISSFFTWWGGWSYGPRYLIVIAIPLVYEGLILITRFNFNKVVFFGLTLYGLFSAWIAKATLVYMIPDYFIQSPGYSNTLNKVLLPEFINDRYNANNFLSYQFGLAPGLAIIFWIMLFAASVYVLTVWYDKWFLGESRSRTV